MNKLFITLYSIVGIVQIYTSYFHGEYVWLEEMSKLLLMPVLIAWSLSQYLKLKQGVLIILALALIFAWLGDYFMCFEGLKEDYFLYGLGSFLLTHILYALIFLKLKKESKDGLEIQLIYKAPVYLIVLVMTNAFVFIHLKSQMYELVLPVVVYMIAIVFMVAMAMNLSKKMGQKAFLMIVSGAICFMLSDAVIAFNKFDALIADSQFYIMFLYILAQFLISRGIILETESKSLL